MDSHALLQLEAVELTTLRVETREGEAGADGEAPAAKGAAEARLTVSFDVRKHVKELRFMVPLTVDVNWAKDASAGYRRIQVGLKGIFSLPDGTPDEVVAKYVPVLCVANLLGIARGIVAQTTGLCGEAPLLLPLLDANTIVAESARKERRKAASQKKQTR